MGHFDNWLCRCSGLGKIISKSGKLTQTTMTYLDDVFVAEIYGTRKEIYGKALDKGIACEDDGFKMLGDIFYKGRFIAKVKEPKQNAWIKGTPDTIVDGCVTDIKNALDLFTFGKAHMSWDYEWQVKGYMFLYELQKGRLFYCLNNMPPYMVLEEQRKMFYTQKKWATFDAPEYLAACEELEKAHNYDNIPLAHRFKFWDLTWHDVSRDLIIESVEIARDYLNKKYELHRYMIEKNEGIINKNEKLLK
jgi:hypothetical protein